MGYGTTEFLAHVGATINAKGQATNGNASASLGAITVGESFAVCGVLAQFTAASLADAIFDLTEDLTTVFELTIQTGRRDPILLTFDPPLILGSGNAAVVNLAAGGAAIVGKVAIWGYRCAPPQ